MEYPETDPIEEWERMMRWFLSACDTLSSIARELHREPTLPEQKHRITTCGGVPPAEHARARRIHGRMRRFTSAKGM